MPQQDDHSPRDCEIQHFPRPFSTQLPMMLPNASAIFLSLLLVHYRGHCKYLTDLARRKNLSKGATQCLQQPGKH